MNELSAIMYVFAGNNGSGKSTTRNLIVDSLGTLVLILTLMPWLGAWMPIIQIYVRYLRVKKTSWEVFLFIKVEK